MMVRVAVGCLTHETEGILDEAAREACWYGNAFPKFHNDDTLWGYMIWTEQQYQSWRSSGINNVPFLCLMAMVIYDWEKPDKGLHQATWAMRYLAALASCVFP